MLLGAWLLGWLAAVAALDGVAEGAAAPRVTGAEALFSVLGSGSVVVSRGVDERFCSEVWPSRPFSPLSGGESDPFDGEDAPSGDAACPFGDGAPETE